MLKQILATTALSLALVLPAASQEAPAPTPEVPAAPDAATAPQEGLPAPGTLATEPPAPPPLMPVDLGNVTADQLIGITLVNANEETLGTVDDALLTSDGKIESVVVSFGGFLGFGAKTVELSMDQVEIMSREGTPYVAMTDLTPETLETLPAYEKG